MALIDHHCHYLLGLYNPYQAQELSSALSAIRSHQHYQAYLQAFKDSSVSYFNFYTVNYLDACVTLAHQGMLLGLIAAPSCALEVGRYSVGIGLHPYYVAQLTLNEVLAEIDREVALLERLHKVEGIILGEIGVDRRLEMPLLEQLSIVERFIDATYAFNRPYSFHCVGAYDELGGLLSRKSIASRSTIHGFNGSLSQGQSLIKRGCKLSFGRALLAKQNHKKFSALKEYSVSWCLESDFDGAHGSYYPQDLILELSCAL